MIAIPLHGWGVRLKNGDEVDAVAVVLDEEGTPSSVICPNVSLTAFTRMYYAEDPDFDGFLPPDGEIDEDEDEPPPGTRLATDAEFQEIK